MHLRLVALLIPMVLISSNSYAAVKAGSACTKVGAKSVSGGKSYICIKRGKKLIWDKGVVVAAKPQPSESASLIPIPSPSVVVTPTASPSTTASASPSPSASLAPSPSMSASPAGYTMADVRTHNSARSCWSAINGNVYDLTAWISLHPGGASAIQSLCGVDGSASFASQHGGQAKPELRLTGYQLGPLTK